MDGGLDRWIADGYETTDMMVKKPVFKNNSKYCGFSSQNNNYTLITFSDVFNVKGDNVRVKTLALIDER